jgi:hypothetical protein
MVDERYHDFSPTTLLEVRQYLLFQRQLGPRKEQIRQLS